MILTRMYSEDGLREAHVVRHTTGLWVDMFERNDQEKLVQRHKVSMEGHSEYYAEDAAENWVMYVIRN
jgi:hypothetical protein